MRLFFICLVLLPFVVTAQQNAVKDSLLKLLSSSKEDTNKVLLLYQIGQEFENTNPELAKSYYTQAKQISRQLNFTMGLLKYYSNYTAVLNMQARYDSSLALNEEALLLANRYGNEQRVAIVHQNLSAVYAFLNNSENAIKHLISALSYYEKDENEPGLSLLYNHLAVIFNDVKMYDKAKWYLYKSLKLSLKNKDAEGEAYVLMNLGFTYRKQKLYDSALMKLRETVTIGREDSNSVILGNSLTSIAAIYMAQDQFDSLYRYSKEALYFSERIPDSLNIANNLYHLAKYYFNKMDINKSEGYVLRGLKIAEANGYIETQEIYADFLSALALVKGDLQKYNEYKRRSDELSEKYFNEQMQETVLALDKKYETEKKEQQLKLQQASIHQKNTLNYILTGSLASLLLISLLAYRTYLQKRKIQEHKISELEKEKQLFATQSLLKGQEEERNRLAKDLHDGLGGLLSGVKLQLGAMKGNLILSEEHGKMFNNALGKLDESIDEMRRVAHNMMPEALMKLGLQQALQDYCDGLSESQSFNIKTEFHGLGKRVVASTEVVVYRIVQELLNNAVKYSTASIILAQVMRNENNLSITVEDNGKGFDREKVSGGTGLKNVRSRVDYLKGVMDIKSVLGKGTSVHIDCLIDDNG